MSNSYHSIFKLMLLFTLFHFLETSIFCFIEDIFKHNTQAVINTMILLF